LFCPRICFKIVFMMNTASLLQQLNSFLDVPIESWPSFLKIKCASVGAQGIVRSGKIENKYFFRRSEFVAGRFTGLEEFVWG